MRWIPAPATPLRHKGLSIAQEETSGRGESACKILPEETSSSDLKCPSWSTKTRRLLLRSVTSLCHVGCSVLQAERNGEEESAARTAGPGSAGPRLESAAC